MSALLMSLACLFVFALFIIAFFLAITAAESALDRMDPELRKRTRL